MEPTTFGATMTVRSTRVAVIFRPPLRASDRGPEAGCWRVAVGDILTELRFDSEPDAVAYAYALRTGLAQPQFGVRPKHLQSLVRQGDAGNEGALDSTLASTAASGRS
jgi:hypothetical protein